MKKFGVAFSILILCQVSLGQDVYSEFENYVDPFTGDLQFSEQLMTISTSTGVSIPITLSYNSNVTTNQKSSWVGLGFNLDMGEIVREIKGGADDVGYLQKKTEITISGTTTSATHEESFIHPLMEYFQGNDQLGGDDGFYASDILYTSFNGRSSYPVAAFDQFRLSSPLFAGNFNMVKPSFELKRRFLGARKTTIDDKTYISEEHPHYPWWNDPNNDPNEDLSSYDRFQFEDDPTGNNFIRYYTVHGIYNNLYSAEDGFIKYVDESSNAFNYGYDNGASPSPISAFTVYLQNGMKLHYSLPVYVQAKRNYIFRHDDSGLPDLNIPVELHQSKDLDYHIKSWKLTAITGPDYNDLNNNGVVDNGDQGTWVRYYYSKSTGYLKTKTPLFGTAASSGSSDDEAVQGNESFYFSSTVDISEDAHYYLDKIETDIQTVIFYKDVKEDDYLLDGTNKFPSLYLKRIVKYGVPGHTCSKNNLIVNVHSSLNTINNQYLNFRNSTYFEADYQFEPEIILKQKVFNYDYSLAPGYQGNVRNSLTLSVLLDYGEANSPGYSDKIYNLSTVYGTGGKLTLTNIDNQEYNGISVYGDYLFNYSFNPSHNINAYDCWGFYTNDITSLNAVRENRPTKPNSQAGAWCLSGVIFPSGIKANFIYEHDRYVRNLSADNSPNNGSIIVPIKSMEVIGYSNEGSTGNQKSYGTYKFQLYNPDDIDFLTGHGNRIVRLVGSYTPCGTSLYNIRVGGGWKYSADGSQYTGLDGLSIVSSPLNGEISVKTRVKNGTSTNDNLNAVIPCQKVNQPHKMVLFFEVLDPEYVGGGNRVASINVLENAQAIQSYNVDFDYGQGSIGSKSTLFFRNVDSLNAGSGLTSINSLPPTACYFMPKVYRRAIGGTLKDYTQYEYEGEDMLNRPAVTSIKSQYSDKIIIPTVLYKSVAFSLFWNMMNDSARDDQVPDVVDCYIRTVLEENILVNTGLNLSDFEGVQDYFVNHPESDYTLESCPFGKMNGEFKCYRGSVFSAGQFFYRYDPSYPYFKIYTQETAFNLDAYIKLEAKYTDRKNLWGKVKEISKYDSDNNKIAESKYVYSPFAKYEWIYHTNLKYTNPDNIHKTKNILQSLHLSKDYYRVAKTTTFSNGQKSYSKAPDIESATAMPRLEESVNIMGEYRKKENLFDLASFRGKMSAVRISDSETNPSTWYNNKNENFRRIGIPDGAADALDGKNYIIDFATTSKLYPIEYYKGDEAYASGVAIEEIGESTLWFDPSDYIVKQQIHHTGDIKIFNMQLATDWKGLVVKENHVSRNGSISERKINTLFGPNYELLEARIEPAAIYAATKYAQKGRFPFAKLENVRYRSFTASGFEFLETNSLFEGEVIGAAYRYKPTIGDIGGAHTGSYVAKLTAGKRAIYYTDAGDLSMSHLEAGRVYSTSVWVHGSSFGNPFLKVELRGSIDGGSTLYHITKYAYMNESQVDVNGWKLLTLDFEVPLNYTSADPSANLTSLNFYDTGNPETSINIIKNGRLVITMESPTGTAYFDDFRFSPADSDLDVRIFDPVRGHISEVLDNNNFYQRYYYDEAGRITEVFQETPEGVVKIQDNSYVNN